MHRLFLVALLVTFVACRDDASTSGADPGPASTGPTDAGATPANDAATSSDGARPNDDASTGDAGCTPCVVGTSAVGCCLQ